MIDPKNVNENLYDFPRTEDKKAIDVPEVWPGRRSIIEWLADFYDRHDVASVVLFVAGVALVALAVVWGL